LKIEAIVQFIGLPPLSLRGARFLAYASEQAPQSRWEAMRLPRPDKSGLAMTKSVVLDESSFGRGKE